MFDANITWGDLFKVVLFILATGVLFYLLLAVANLVGILKNLNRILDKNRANIDNTLDKLPEITDNVAKVSDIIRKETESIQKVVQNVGKISDSAKDAAEMLKKDILVKVKGIVDILDWIKKLFEKDEKKKEIIYKYKYKPEKETVEQHVTGQAGFNDNKAYTQDCAAENGDPSGHTLNETVSDGDRKRGENQQGAGI